MAYKLGFGKIHGWGAPLALQYPLLYNIVQRKDVSVADVLSHNPLNVVFRWTLTENKWEVWLHLVRRLMDINLNDNKDVFVWNGNGYVHC
jgi:hypothetical protein